MSDLTAKFHEHCKHAKTLDHIDIKNTQKRKILNDTFQDECDTLKIHLDELNTLITDIRPLYLSDDRDLMNE